MIIAGRKGHKFQVSFHPLGRDQTAVRFTLLGVMNSPSFENVVRNSDLAKYKNNLYIYGNEKLERNLSN